MIASEADDTAPAQQSSINTIQPKRSPTADRINIDDASVSSSLTDTPVEFPMSTPAISSASARISPAPPVALLPPFAACRVAVIDDEAANCRICKRYLTQLGVPNDNIIVLADGTDFDSVVCWHW